jgi:ribonuclease D
VFPGPKGWAQDHPRPGILGCVWPDPVWIRTPGEAEALARELHGVPAIAVDTEADSLHHYPERLCLVQIGDPQGRVFFVDTLVVHDLEPLRPLFADPATAKVLHSGDNDVVYLKRRFGLAFAGLSDTMLAARFLGVRELGLERLLLKYLDVQPVRSQQKTDWARRPLTPIQEAYAAEDVRHLIILRDKLLAELEAIGRREWLEEECEALAALPVPERPSDEDAYRRIRGASRLLPRGLAVLRALYLQREAWALAEHRPPFKVLNPEALVALAERLPADLGGLAGVPGLSPRLVERYGEGLVKAVRQGLGERLPPEPPRGPRPARPAVTPASRQRAEALRKWRAEAAEGSGLDPGVLLPQRLIEALALDPPADLDGLRSVPGLRRWRIDAYGRAILAALRAP